MIVDFTGLPVGTEIHLINLGPDEPFDGLPRRSPTRTRPDRSADSTVVPLTGRDRPSAGRVAPAHSVPR